MKSATILLVTIISISCQALRTVSSELTIFCYVQKFENLKMYIESKNIFKSG
jgi:hypothetical protein